MSFEDNKDGFGMWRPDRPYGILGTFRDLIDEVFHRKEMRKGYDLVDWYLDIIKTKGPDSSDARNFYDTHKENRWFQPIAYSATRLKRAMRK